MCVGGVKSVGGSNGKVQFFIFRVIFIYVKFLQESGNLAENVEKSLRWRSFWIPVLIMLLVTVFQWEFFFTLDVFPFWVAIVDDINFIKKKNDVRDVYAGFFFFVFFAFSDPGFCFCFQFFRSVALNKNPKRCLNALSLNLSCLWALSMAMFWVFSADLCAIMCVERWELQQ